MSAQRYQVPTNGQATILAGADLYQSDFGVLQIVPNRFMEARTALMIQKDELKLAFLSGRKMVTTDLAKTGDSDRRQILCEYTVQVNNEKAHGAVYDLTVA